ncbi:MAG: hypothetical protein AB1571_02645 [Nanoarchaeota archaeon]
MKIGLLFGREPSADILDDLATLKSFNSEQISQFITKTIEWYPKESIQEEWNEFIKGKTEEEKNNIAKALRLLLFLMKEKVKQNLSDEEFRNDLKKMEFPEEHIDNLIGKINLDKNNIKKKLEKISLLPGIIEINWRIDKKICDNVIDNFDENIILLQFIFVENRELKQKTFELTPEGVNRFKEIINAIQNNILR